MRRKDRLFSTKRNPRLLRAMARPAAQVLRPGWSRRQPENRRRPQLLFWSMVTVKSSSRTRPFLPSPTRKKEKDWRGLGL